MWGTPRCRKVLRWTSQREIRAFAAAGNATMPHRLDEAEAQGPTPRYNQWDRRSVTERDRRRCLRSVQKKSQSCRIDKAETVSRIKGENGCVHRRDNSLQESRSLHAADSLLLEEVGKLIDLDCEFTQRISPMLTACAKRKVLFPQSSNHI